MSKFLKRMYPALIALAVTVAGMADPSVRAAIGQFAVAHPTLASLALTLYIGLANFLRGLQVVPVEDAKHDLGKSLDKESASKG